MRKRDLTAVSNVFEHGCTRVRRMLDSYLAGELTVETNHEILEHLSRCPSCQRETEARERLKTAIRRIAEVAPGPRADFEAELATLLSRTRLPPPRSRAPMFLFAAAATLAAAALTVVFRGSSPRNVSEAGPPARPVDLAAYGHAAGAQLDCALHYAWPSEPPPIERLEARVDEALRPALHAIVGKLAGYDVLAAHQCIHTGRSITHVVVRRHGGGELISILAMPRTEGSLPRAAAAVEEHLSGEAGEPDVILTGGRERGQSIVAAETKDFLLFVVSGERRDSVAVGRAVLPTLAARL